MNAQRLGQSSDPQSKLRDVGEVIKPENVKQKYVWNPIDLQI